MTAAIDRIKREMNLFRQGLVPLPEDYIILHMSCALETKGEMLQKYGFRFLMQEVVPDGWCDGMRVLRVVCEDQVGKLHDVRWSDSNGGSWFERNTESSSSGLMYVPELRPGFL